MNDDERGGEVSSGEGSDRTPPILSEVREADSVVATGGGEVSGTSPQRLHPLTLLFSLLGLIRGLIVPALILLVVGGETMLGAVMLIFVMFSLVGIVARYWSFTYWIESGELVTRQGILSRHERHIPLHRVHDLSLEQGVLHRFFKVAEVQVETAGGQGPEASLSVLSVSEADRLRETLFAHKGDSRSKVEGEVEPGREEETLIRELTTRELVIAGLTSNYAASAMALVVVAWGMLDDVVAPDTYERWMEQAAQAIERSLYSGRWLMIVGGGVLVVLLGLAISVVGSLLLFYRFSLNLKGEDLQRRYGLFTRRASSIPRKRIQLAKVEEPWLRRQFQLATMRVDTAGGGGQENENQNTGRDLLMPVIPRGEVDRILHTCFDDLQEEESEKGTAWNRVSRKAIQRGTIRGLLVCLLIAGLAFVLYNSWHGFWIFLLAPLIYWVNRKNYEHLGYRLTQGYFRSCQGWLSRATYYVPIRNIQNVSLRQNPFDRRYGVMTLTVDTAGQNVRRGRPELRNLPETEAIRLASLLVHRAAATRFRW